MKNNILNTPIRILLIIFLVLFSVSNLYSYNGDFKSVELSAIVSDNPPQINLIWKPVTNGGTYEIYRRSTGANSSWGSSIASLSSTATNYIDNNVLEGIEYEYKFTRGETATGYIKAGINIPLKDNFGKIIFLIDNSISFELSNELDLMEKMMVADGWQVIRSEVSRTASVVEVKNAITGIYNQDPQNTKALYLFGHIPVPYSGELYPDFHSNHKGAWPADVFYGDIDGNWTDVTVNTRAASYPGEPERNHNIPGDGKYDQNVPPSSVELQVGRVDMFDLPAMNVYGNEIELLRNYIRKNQNFRYKNIDLERRAIVYAGFENNSATPSADIYRESAALFGQNKITRVDDYEYFDTLSTNSYLWGHSEGGGHFRGAHGVGTTSTHLAVSDPKCSFYTTFGSWFGDWDTPDNFLRAFLATPNYGLTNAWIGHNHWYAQDVALGYNIGQAIQVFQNNSSNANLGYRLQNLTEVTFIKNWKVHIGLMGDPTLRIHTVSPVSFLTATQNGVVTWTASTDNNIVGYHVYKASNELGPYTRLTNDCITETSFTDVSPYADSWYMVRAVKLETSGSGTYYNASQGIIVQANNDVSFPSAINDLQCDSITANSVVLKWTATGDDQNTGTATSYDIRYSTSEISLSNFGAATRVSNAPVPSIAGTIQHVKISKLIEGETYYFAMKTSDEVPLTSVMSNQVVANLLVSEKIPLSTSMMTSLSGGDATRFVDEQEIAGYPAEGASVPCVTKWNPGSYPATCYIDLGQPYAISKIYLADSNGFDDFTISYGAPNNWTYLLTESCNSYLTWKKHVVSQTTQFLKLTMNSGSSNINEIVLYGIASPASENNPPIANAGIDQTVDENSQVTLNADNSNDPDDDDITYLWTAPENIVLSSVDAKLPSFTAPYVYVDTPLEFTLVVNDGEFDSEVDTVIVTVVDVDHSVLPHYNLTSATLVGDESDCFNALNTITVAGNETEVIIEQAATATFIAGQSIMFLPGFNAQAGSQVNAFITTQLSFCDQLPQTIVANEPSIPKSITTDNYKSIPNELSDQKQVIIYPNPNSGVFTIELSNFERKTEILLVDMIGRVLFRKINKKTEIIEVNLPLLNHGVYNVIVNDGLVVESQRIIIHKN